MGYSSGDAVVIAHAVLGGLLGMVIWPLGAIVGRYLRSYHPKWVRIHYWINGIIGTSMLIVTFALGRYAVGPNGGWAGTHWALGLVLLILGVLQAFYGTLIHQARLAPPISGLKSLLRYFHPVAGIVIIALGYIQVYTGFNDEWLGAGPGVVPRGVLIAWAILLALGAGAYLGGFSLLPKQWRARRDAVAFGAGPDGIEKSG